MEVKGLFPGYLDEGEDGGVCLTRSGEGNVLLKTYKFFRVWAWSVAGPRV